MLQSILSCLVKVVPNALMHLFRTNEPSSGGLLTLKPAVARVGFSTLVAQQLISEAHRASAPVSIALRAGLEVDGGPVRTICPETEHLPRGPLAVRHQQLQLSGAFNEYAGSAERRRRFDADGGAPGGGQVGLQDHPESLARVYPPHRALCTAQPHLEYNPGVHTSCKTAGSRRGNTSN